MIHSHSLSWIEGDLSWKVVKREERRKWRKVIYALMRKTPFKICESLINFIKICLTIIIIINMESFPDLKRIRLKKRFERNSSMAHLRNQYPTSARDMFPKSTVDEFYVLNPSPSRKEVNSVFNETDCWPSHKWTIFFHRWWLCFSVKKLRLKTRLSLLAGN